MPSSWRLSFCSGQQIRIWACSNSIERRLCLPAGVLPGCSGRPVAKKIPTEKQVNGAVLVDDDAWLRERASPQVHQYLEAENAYAEATTASEKRLAGKLY